MYLIVKYGKVSTEFVTVWVKHFRVPVGDLHLQSKSGQNREYFIIRNQEFGQRIKSDYEEYKCSGKTMNEYFGRTILKATKYFTDTDHIFKLKNVASATKPLLLHQCRTSFYLESKPKAVSSQIPIKMSLEDIFSIYDIDEEFSLENIDEFEEDNQVQIHFHRLKYLDRHGRGEQVVTYRCPTVPGTSSRPWPPIHKINIGNI